MQDDTFAWDDSKAASNYADHGVTFEAARAVFKDPFAIEWLDDRKEYGEARYAILGMVENRLLYVAYTMRGETVRLISARGAEPHESRRDTMKKTAKPPLHDWKRFDGMTEAQRHAAALKDLDAQPLQPEDMTRMKRTPQVSVIRRALS
ncbi:MAG: BrnT family toxin, partial [Methylococcales bacterium]